MADADELRTLLGRFPAGIAVVTVDANGQRLGLTVGSLVGLSLDPPLVGLSVSRQAALHELLREAGGCAISLLAAGQDWLAEHFARGVPPIGMWHGIATEPGASDAPLLVGALGWLSAGSATSSRWDLCSSATSCGSSTAPTRRPSSACAACTSAPERRSK